MQALFVKLVLLSPLYFALACLFIWKNIPFIGANSLKLLLMLDLHFLEEKKQRYNIFRQIPITVLVTGICNVMAINLLSIPSFVWDTTAMVGSIWHLKLFVRTLHLKVFLFKAHWSILTFGFLSRYCLVRVDVFFKTDKIFMSSYIRLT